MEAHIILPVCLCGEQGWVFHLYHFVHADVCHRHGYHLGDLGDLGHDMDDMDGHGRGERNKQMGVHLALTRVIRGDLTDGSKLVFVSSGRM